MRKKSPNKSMLNMSKMCQFFKLWQILKFCSINESNLFTQKKKCLLYKPFSISASINYYIFKNSHFTCLMYNKKALVHNL